MSEVDLSPLRDNEVQYGQLASNVEEKYKCDWDDAVHDSYGRYVKHIREYADGVKTIKNRAEIIQREVQELKILDLISYADSLCGEADSV